MAIKYIDPDDMYVVRLMFGCGHGHAMPPGFTHWESGEGCPFVHSQEHGPGYGPGPTTNESAHLYERLFCVPIVDGNGADLWERACSNPNKFGHYPLAPDGLKEGQVIGDTIKLKKGARISKKVLAKYPVLALRPIVRYDPPPRADRDAAA